MSIICLISNRFDSYDRHWVCSHDEEKEEFIKRMRKCYLSDNKWILDFYEGNHISN